MRYLIILLLSVTLLIILEYREQKQSVTKATTTTKTTTSKKTQPVQFPVKQRQAQTKARKPTISGFGSKIVDGVVTYELPDGGRVSFREGTFGDKLTRFLGLYSNKVQRSS